MNVKVIRAFVSFTVDIYAPVALLSLTLFIVATIVENSALNLWKIASGVVVSIAKEMPEDMRKIKFLALMMATDGIE